MIAGIAAAREHYARELETICGITTPALTRAFAAVPRERFLGPGPWTVRSEADRSGPRTTPDANPERVYHDMSIAIDPARQLFNGAPSVWAPLFDALALATGQRVLQVGCGTGYYAAILGQVVGSTGLVDAVEADAGLAARAAAALGEWPWIRVREGDGTAHAPSYDAIVVCAGVTHPLPSWLDALAPGGRIVLPLTVAMPPGAPIGKGLMLLATRTASGFDARCMNMVMIYNAEGIRAAAAEPPLMQALRRGDFESVRQLRRDAHDPGDSCWLHGGHFCLSRA